jgi:protein subunit release factor A
VEIAEEDLRIDVWSNISGCAVRVVHLPTCAVAESEWIPSGPQNQLYTHRAKEEAMAQLRERLAALPE